MTSNPAFTEKNIQKANAYLLCSRLEQKSLVTYQALRELVRMCLVCQHFDFNSADWISYNLHVISSRNLGKMGKEFIFQFSRRSWGRKTWRTPKNVCVGAMVYTDMYSCCCYKYKVLILPSTRFFESAGSSLHHFIYNGVNKCTSHFIFVRFWFTALFTNMWILKFKSQLTIAFFAAVNHLNGPLRKQNFTLTGSKGQGLWFVIGGFRSVLCVSVFQGSLLVIIIMIDGSEKRNCEGGF